MHAIGFECRAQIDVVDDQGGAVFGLDGLDQSATGCVGGEAGWQ
jgi:hypothetical protein